MIFNFSGKIVGWSVTEKSNAALAPGMSLAQKGWCGGCTVMVQQWGPREPPSIAALGSWKHTTIMWCQLQEFFHGILLCEREILEQHGFEPHRSIDTQYWIPFNSKYTIWSWWNPGMQRNRRSGGQSLRLFSAMLSPWPPQCSRDNCILIQIDWML